MLNPFEALAALLLAGIISLLLVGVISRYVFSLPFGWIDDVVSIAFLWLTMIGSAIAIHRNEHLRLALFVQKLPPRLQRFCNTLAGLLVVTFLAVLMEPSFDYMVNEWPVITPVLNISNSFRVGAIVFGNFLMLAIVVVYTFRTSTSNHLAVAASLIVAVAGLCWFFSPTLRGMGNVNIIIFLVGLTAFCLMAGVPIAFCFGVATLAFLAFSTSLPLVVVVGRMDEGMSSLILISVPIFVLLGCVLDSTGMGKAIIDFLALLVGHVRAGMSYVLLGSMFIVSGISGSKVSDMATVAPALFPEMKRRGHKPEEMTALLATGAAMADTVPPSIVLIVLGSVAGVSIAGLFNAGLMVAAVLLVSLAVLARWKSRDESLADVRRPSFKLVKRIMLIAAPALVLPFLIRGAVGGGIATATEVSTIAVLYAMFVGKILYGGISLRKIYAMCVETAALSGAILMILGTALAMAWAVTQSGVANQLTAFLTTLPGGWVSFVAVSILLFLILGSVLEGLPALLLFAPLLFPIARQLGINDVHYSMVIVTAMNIGLMAPPIGVGFYIACRISDVSPEEVIGAIWPYIAALIVGLLIIAYVPWISTSVL